MTMLDRMRRHRNWLKYSLGIVVLSFIVFYIPSFLRTERRRGRPERDPRDRGRPDDHGRHFRRAYQASAAELPARLRRQPERAAAEADGHRSADPAAADRRAAAVAEADGLAWPSPTPRWRSASTRFPAFQQNGQFAGQARLRAGAPDAAASALAGGVRGQPATGAARRKLVPRSPTGSASTTTRSTAEFKRRNEKVKLELVVFSADKFHDQAQATDADVQKWFDQHKEQYRIGEKRKIRYLLMDTDALKAKTWCRRATSSVTTRRTSSSTRRPSRCARVTSCSRPTARTTRR